MIKKCIVSHGDFANGLGQSLSLFLGEDHGFDVISAYTTIENPQLEIENYMKNVTDQDVVIFLTDILGGSVNTLCMPYLSRANTYVITGVNFPMCLALSALAKEVTITALRHLVDEARTSIQFMNDYEFTVSDEDE